MVDVLQCQFCQLKFGSTYKLIPHIFFGHRKKILKKIVQKKEELAFKCPAGCNYESKTEHNFGAGGFKPNDDEFVSWLSNSLLPIEIHINTHTQEPKATRCEYCQLELGTTIYWNHLSMHMQKQDFASPDKLGALPSTPVTPASNSSTGGSASGTSQHESSRVQKTRPPSPPGPRPPSPPGPPPPYSPPGSPPASPPLQTAKAPEELAASTIPFSSFFKKKSASPESKIKPSIFTKEDTPTRLERSLSSREDLLQSDRSSVSIGSTSLSSLSGSSLASNSASRHIESLSSLSSRTSLLTSSLSTLKELDTSKLNLSVDSATKLSQDERMSSGLSHSVESKDDTNKVDQASLAPLKEKEEKVVTPKPPEKHKISLSEYTKIRKKQLSEESKDVSKSSLKEISKSEAKPETTVLEDKLDQSTKKEEHQSTSVVNVKTTVLENENKKFEQEVKSPKERKLSMDSREIEDLTNERKVPGVVTKERRSSGQSGRIGDYTRRSEVRRSDEDLRQTGDRMRPPTPLEPPPVTPPVHHGPTTPTGVAPSPDGSSRSTTPGLSRPTTPASDRSRRASADQRTRRLSDTAKEKPKPVLTEEMERQIIFGGALLKGTKLSISTDQSKSESKSEKSSPVEERNSVSRSSSSPDDKDKNRERNEESRKSADKEDPDKDKTKRPSLETRRPSLEARGPSLEARRPSLEDEKEEGEDEDLVSKQKEKEEKERKRKQEKERPETREEKLKAVREEIERRFQEEEQKRRNDKEAQRKHEAELREKIRIEEEKLRKEKEKIAQEKRRAKEEKRKAKKAKRKRKRSRDSEDEKRSDDEDEPHTKRDKLESPKESEKEQKSRPGEPAIQVEEMDTTQNIEENYAAQSKAPNQYEQLKLNFLSKQKEKLEQELKMLESEKETKNLEDARNQQQEPMSSQLETTGNTDDMEEDEDDDLEAMMRKYNQEKVDTNNMGEHTDPSSSLSLLMSNYIDDDLKAGNDDEPIEVPDDDQAPDGEVEQVSASHQHEEEPIQIPDDQPTTSIIEMDEETLQEAKNAARDIMAPAKRSKRMKAASQLDCSLCKEEGSTNSYLSAYQLLSHVYLVHRKKILSRSRKVGGMTLSCPEGCGYITIISKEKTSIDYFTDSLPRHLEMLCEHIRECHTGEPEMETCQYCSLPLQHSQNWSWQHLANHRNNLRFYCDGCSNFPFKNEVHKCPGSGLETFQAASDTSLSPSKRRKRTMSEDDILGKSLDDLEREADLADSPGHRSSKVKTLGNLVRFICGACGKILTNLSTWLNHVRLDHLGRGHINYSHDIRCFCCPWMPPRFEKGREIIGVNNLVQHLITDHHSDDWTDPDFTVESSRLVQVQRDMERRLEREREEAAILVPKLPAPCTTCKKQINQPKMWRYHCLAHKFGEVFCSSCHTFILGHLFLEHSATCNSEDRDRVKVKVDKHRGDTFLTTPQGTRFNINFEYNRVEGAGGSVTVARTMIGTRVVVGNGPSHEEATRTIKEQVENILTDIKLKDEEERKEEIEREDKLALINLFRQLAAIDKNEESKIYYLEFDGGQVPVPTRFHYTATGVTMIKAITQFRGETITALGTSRYDSIEKLASKVNELHKSGTRNGHEEGIRGDDEDETGLLTNDLPITCSDCRTVFKRQFTFKLHRSSPCTA